MNRINLLRKLSAGLLLSGLALTALPASAVSLDGGATLTRSNLQGTSFVNLSPASNHFCFLTQVAVEETDTAGERATCRVKVNGLVWTLESILGNAATVDADVSCTATCYKN